MYCMWLRICLNPPQSATILIRSHNAESRREAWSPHLVFTLISSSDLALRLATTDMEHLGSATRPAVVHAPAAAKLSKLRRSALRPNCSPHMARTGSVANTATVAEASTMNRAAALVRWALAAMVAVFTSGDGVNTWLPPM